MALSWKYFTLSRKVGSSRIYQIKAWQLILECDLLGTKVLSDSNRIISSSTLLDVYPLTDGSFATIIQNLPCMSPTPVTMPPELTYSLPYSSYPAKGENYKKGDPGSSNFSILSLTRSLPCLCNFCSTFLLFWSVALIR